MASIHKRKKSQIWLQVREGNKHFLESCYVLAISKNPVFKYGDSHVFLFRMWRTKRNLKIAKKKEKKRKEICHVPAKFLTRKFDCSGRVNWQCNKGYRQPPDVCGKEVADPMGKNNDRRTSVGNRPPTGHETTRERAGDQRRAEVSGENEHAFEFVSGLFPTSFPSQIAP